MSNFKNLLKIISSKYNLFNNIYINKENDDDSNKGYWSNISKDAQEKFLLKCKELGSLSAVKNLFPNYEDIIFDPTRAVALKFLDIKTTDIGVDYGCMWGNLLIHCAKKSKYMVGIDQTIPSLKFLNQRLKEENLENVSLINENLRNSLPFNNDFDFGIINGVLEWIPDENEIDLNQHFYAAKNDKSTEYKSEPFNLQLKFLEQVNKNLKQNGKLYLAIENRWDYQHFLWKRDPHSNLFFTAICPRWLSNIISKVIYGRPYVNYIYSMKGLNSLLAKAGFSIINKYAVFPDYRFPQKILDMQNIDTSDYEPVYINNPTKNIIKKAFRRGRYLLDIILYKKLKLMTLAPSFIIIAKKD